MIWFLHWPPIMGKSPRACVGAIDKIITLVIMSSLGASRSPREVKGRQPELSNTQLRIPTPLPEPQRETSAVTATAVKPQEHR